MKAEQLIKGNKLRSEMEDVQKEIRAMQNLKQKIYFESDEAIVYGLRSHNVLLDREHVPDVLLEKIFDSLIDTATKHYEKLEREFESL